MFDEFFSKADELRRDGTPFATAIVVRAEKPTSAKPGDKAIITPDGVMHGWIGGSCAQPTVVEEAMAAIADDESRLIRLSPLPGTQPVPEGVKELPMTCFSGGTLDIHIEPQQPQPRLMIFGSLPIAQALAHLGKAMSYRVIAVDPEKGGTSLEKAADEVLGTIEGAAARINPLTYVVVATHGRFDEPALKLALRSEAAYVGLVSSHKRAEPIRDHLRQNGLGEDELARLEVPAGLDIQARRGDEIALSIMAEIVQVRRNAEGVEWPSTDEDSPGLQTTASAPDPAIAIDPICKMTVEVEDALHSHEHEGETYYFCCGGCKTKFAAEPERWLQPAPPR